MMRSLMLRHVSASFRSLFLISFCRAEAAREYEPIAENSHESCSVKVEVIFATWRKKKKNRKKTIQHHDSQWATTFTPHHGNTFYREKRKKKQKLSYVFDLISDLNHIHPDDARVLIDVQIEDVIVDEAQCHLSRHLSRRHSDVQ